MSKISTPFTRSGKYGIFFFIFFLMINAIAMGQALTVTGTVTGADDGSALPGVSVVIKGTQTSTTTDLNGKFSIKANQGNTITFTYIGYKTKEVVVQRSLVDISLETDITSLNEVVVLGYGSQKKADITGAVATIKPDNLDERPLIRVDQALVGQLAGVRVKQTSGIPGRAFSVQIRGTGSISAGTEPLYVVDGFALSGGNPLDNISPNDIETIQVLKDAASAAIYGSRGSNGVVIISTKSGKIGKPKINFNTYTGVNQVTKKLDVLSGEEWVDRAIEYINFNWVNSAATGRTADQTNEQRRVILGLPAGQANISFMTDDRWTQPGHPGLDYVDFQDAFFRKGLVQDFQLSASGGTPNVKYYVAGDYLNQEGVTLGVGYKRYSARANVEIMPNEKLKFGMNIAPAFSLGSDPNADTKDGLTHIAVSHQPVVESNAGFLSGTKTFGQYRWGTSRVSPVAVANAAIAQNRTFRTYGTVYADYTVIPGLSVRSNINFDNVDGNTKNFRPAEINDASGPTTGGFNGSNRKSFSNENYFTFKKTLAEKHAVSLIGGFSYQYNKSNNYSIAGGTYGTNTVTVINGALNTLTTGSTSESDDALISYYSDAKYSFNDKYLLTASVRRDGSSRFGANNKWGTFPSVSAGWRISGESFMKKFEVISDLKIRASWGITGTNNIGDYGSIAALSGANTSFGATSVIGQSPSNIPNPDLSWEESVKTNYGLDFGLFAGRITGSLDLYRSLNRDLLLNIPVPSITGFGSALTNIGSVENKGWELELNTRNTTGRLSWNTSLNLSHNENTVKKLGPNNTSIGSNGGFNENHSFLIVGMPMGSLFLVKEIGVLSSTDIANKYPIFPNEVAGDPKYLDANGDGKIDANDAVYSGNPAPDLTWGITNTFKYKGFDLNVFVQGQNGGLIYSMFGRAMDRTGMGYQDNPLGIYRDRWRSDASPGTTHKSPTKMGFIKNTDWLYSSDYVRLRDVTLGFNIRNVFKSKVISGARIYATAENFFGRDKYYGGFNPEAVNTSGEDYGGFPLSKGLVMGFNVTF